MWYLHEGIHLLALYYIKAIYSIVWFIIDICIRGVHLLALYYYQNDLFNHLIYYYICFCLCDCDCTHIVWNKLQVSRSVEGMPPPYQLVINILIQSIESLYYFKSIISRINLNGIHGGRSQHLICINIRSLQPCSFPLNAQLFHCNVIWIRTVDYYRNDLFNHLIYIDICIKGIYLLALFCCQYRNQPIKEILLSTWFIQLSDLLYFIITSSCPCHWFELNASTGRSPHLYVLISIHFNVRIESTTVSSYGHSNWTVDYFKNKFHRMERISWIIILKVVSSYGTNQLGSIYCRIHPIVSPINLNIIIFEGSCYVVVTVSPYHTVCFHIGSSSPPSSILNTEYLWLF